MRHLGIIFLSLCLLLIGGSGAAAQISVFETFVFDTRADLELLADAVFEGTRPESWIGTQDPSAMSAVTDLWFDNEQVADVVFGAGVRPDGWIGATSADLQILVRNVRHDMEISADETLGVGERPLEWRGAPPIFRCSRTLQNVIGLLQQEYGVLTTTPESVLDFCDAVEAEVEDDLINVVFASEDAQAAVPELILALRGDLERLADETRGLNNRPVEWIGNRDVNSPSFVQDLFLDLEALADAQLGQGSRPEGWIGGVSAVVAVSNQNLRHDLELLADETLGSDTRPNGWQGVDPLARCDPTLQNLVFLVELTYEFGRTVVDPNAEDYCAAVDAAFNTVAENPPLPEELVEGDGLRGDERALAESNWAFTYLDTGATEYMGIMPGGTQFRAWYRNYGESEMVFVSGDDFAVYVNYKFTTLPDLVYDSLPTIEEFNPLTFCDASWCQGPGPTPTSTGEGALAAVLAAAVTPGPELQATPDPDDGPRTGTLQQVSWNNIRVTYITDNLEARTAQVALEICAQPASIAVACQPVTSVTNADGSVAFPVVGTTSDGLNIYDFPYGYTDNIRIEGETLYSNDVWISDPTIR